MTTHDLVFTTNGPVRACCGQPLTECTCGEHESPPHFAGAGGAPLTGNAERFEDQDLDMAPPTVNYQQEFQDRLAANARRGLTTNRQPAAEAGGCPGTRSAARWVTDLG